MGAPLGAEGKGAKLRARCPRRRRGEMCEQRDPRAQRAVGTQTDGLKRKDSGEMPGFFYLRKGGSPGAVGMGKRGGGELPIPSPLSSLPILPPAPLYILVASRSERPDIYIILRSGGRSRVK